MDTHEKVVNISGRVMTSGIHAVSTEVHKQLPDGARIVSVKSAPAPSGLTDTTSYLFTYELPPPVPPVDTLSLAELRGANDRRAEQWTQGAVGLSFRGNELAGETGEACNVIKKIERESMGFVGSRATVADLAEEVADVVICADLIASEAGFDLGEAVRRKFNKTSEKYGLTERL